MLSLRSGRKKPGTFRRKGERFAFEGFFPKISEQSEEIFCFQAGEGLPLAFGFRVGRALAFPLRGEGKQIPCGNLLDEVESFPLTLQRQNTSQNTSSAAYGGSFPSRGSLWTLPSP